MQTTGSPGLVSEKREAYGSRAKNKQLLATRPVLTIKKPRGRTKKGKG